MLSIAKLAFLSQKCILKYISKCTLYTLPKRIDTNGVYINLYTDDIDNNTMKQLINLAEMPYVVGYVAGMPDVHLVGVDIGCGICAVPIKNLTKNQISYKQLLDIQKILKQSIPTGFESHDIPPIGAKSLIENMMSTLAPSEWIRETFNARHILQIGTLGGGNHFVELVHDEHERIWMMLHSGSRNIGNKCAQYYDMLASKQSGSKSKKLASLAIASPEGKDYLKDMKFCQHYAMENRNFMLNAFARVILEVTGRAPMWEATVNIHHNYCDCENCTYIDSKTGEEKNEKLWITRKGATSARKGQLGIIPGSMGTGSFIVRGLGNNESWNSCSHGAGRKMSRTFARNHIRQDDFAAVMDGIVCDAVPSVRDEAPQAYKDLGEVMRNQATLVEVVHRLTPLLNMKGYEEIFEDAKVVTKPNFKKEKKKF
eukprot:GHVL01040974.1.p1 GENE.GHVL01040974.1~~GHVL01040974.1.p1  ORF type:complete len:427 (+),score=102.94 GHVL01040974.1:269-1549(+)